VRIEFDIYVFIMFITQECSKMKCRRTLIHLLKKRCHISTMNFSPKFDPIAKQSQS